MKLRLAIGAAVVLPALTGCSGDLPWSREEPTPTPVPTPVAEPADVPASGGGLTRSNTNDLLFVRKSAPPCASVWIQGRRLDKDYEWCAADQTGEPVAGIRIGACEVITYQNLLYAVPGFKIRVATAPIASDPRYLRELTSCKRTPVPAGQKPAGGNR